MSGTVSPPVTPRPKPEMSLVGYAIGAAMFLLLLPILPFLVVVWLAVRLLGGSRSPEPVTEPTGERGKHRS